MLQDPLGAAVCLYDILKPLVILGVLLGIIVAAALL